MKADAPFWKTKTLAEMTREEWESLCDGCGQCCLHKLVDIDNGDYYVTDIACHMLDCRSCRCRDYENRQQHVPDCVQLTPERIYQTDWLPDTCAYRLIAEGQDLAWWHPLVSGDPETVHTALISVRDFAEPGQPTIEEMSKRVKRTLAARAPRKIA